MKIALLDARRSSGNPENSITVAVRNMLELEKNFSADFFYSADQLRESKDDYDIIVCGFGTFSTEINESTTFLTKNKNATLFLLVSDYEQTTFAPLFYSKRKFHIIKSFCHEMKNKMAQEQFFININALLSGGYNKNNKAVSNIIYYGRWRDGRANYFKEYLQGGVFLSTSVKNKKKFSANGCDPLFLPALSWVDKNEQLKNFKASIYLEDVFTHSNYCCPANRYYEAIKCGVHQLFHDKTLNTFDKYGIEIPSELIFSSRKELIHKFNGIDEKLSIKFMEQAGAKAELDKEDCINSIKLIFSTV